MLNIFWEIKESRNHPAQLASPLWDLPLFTELSTTTRTRTITSRLVNGKIVPLPYFALGSTQSRPLRVRSLFTIFVSSSTSRLRRGGVSELSRPLPSGWASPTCTPTPHRSSTCCPIWVRCSEGTTRWTLTYPGESSCTGATVMRGFPDSEGLQIKDKNKSKEDILPFFVTTCLKSKTRWKYLLEEVWKLNIVFCLDSECLLHEFWVKDGAGPRTDPQ